LLISFWTKGERIRILGFILGSLSFPDRASRSSSRFCLLSLLP
jgi:hypothetical protein